MKESKCSREGSKGQKIFLLEFEKSNGGMELGS